MISIGPSLTGSAARRRAAAGGDTPTVALNIGDAGNATWGNDSNEFPPPDGGYCTKTVTGVGGPFLSSLAILAGATEPPTYNTGQGIHTLGANAALTCATPVVIPATSTDWDLWVYVDLPAAAQMFALTFSGNEEVKFILSPDAPQSGIYDGVGATYTNTPLGSGTKLFRLGFTSGVASIAWTGHASGAADIDTYTASNSFDTLLGNVAAGSYSSTGCYLRAMRIASYPVGYTGRAAYRSAYEIAVSGAALT